MSKTYVDITQLVHWTGKLTGIPRVMYEISVRYLDSPDVQFVIWDNLSRSFVLVDAKSTLKTRGQKITYIDKKKPVAVLFSLGYKVLHRAKGYRVPVPTKVIRSFEILGSIRPSLKFKQGDKIFILWGEQNNKRFIDKLTILHEEGIGIIQVSYDMLPLVTPQFSGHSTDGMAKYNKAIFPIVDLILAISEHTKLDITNWLISRGLNVPPIKVFRLGDDFKMSTPQKPRDKRFIKSGLKGQDYILMVGTIEARKNHALLYYVYKLALKRRVELPKLVVVGRQGWLAKGVYELMTKDPTLVDKIIVLESASDEELSWLYGKAMFTVYPSFYEGWGLPIAESIAHNTPCICSNTSSMPEVADTLVDYFDPYSTDECLQKIQEYMKPATIKKQRKKIGQYRPTSWNTTFTQINHIIKERYNGSN